MLIGYVICVRELVSEGGETRERERERERERGDTCYRFADRRTLAL